ncbi:MAG: GntP family permease, partial [Acidobacteriota bacterium]|nr:GntP family permease [Acidobacteriota bacterium]
MITESAFVALAGLVAVVALLFLLITRFNWHVFIALLVPIVLLALTPGLDRQAFIDAFEQGFGRTIQGIAVVIVLGSILAEALKHTGGIERITISMIRWVGEARMPLALTLSGFVIGLAIFSDVGYLILNPLVHAAAINSGLNMSVMATGLVGAMQLTHAMVPPTPGPLAAVALVGADIGQIIVYGGACTLVASIAGWGYARLAGPHLESPPSHEFVGQSFIEQGREAELPSTWRAYAPILIPLSLIAGQSVTTFSLPADHIVNTAMLYLGWPVVALGIGILLAYRNTTADHAKARTNQWIEDALRASAMIIMVTGLGGALSHILRETPAVDAIAAAVASTGLPAIFLPVVLGIAGNMITGSTTVGVITAASVAAPMMDTLGLSPEATMLAGA